MYIESKSLERVFEYKELIHALKIGFSSSIESPQRHHHKYSSEQADEASTLLLMPAWDNKKRMGVKVVTVSPENGKLGLPSIHGDYLLFNSMTGEKLAQFDAKYLTAARTACASALASIFLSKESSNCLLMIGSGALAPHLIKAHCSIRPINKVLIWSRTKRSSERLIKSFEIENVIIEGVNSIEEGMKEADIVSCATLSEKALIEGKWTRKGQHIDLVGAYKPSMREGDDELIRKAEVFVDTRQGMNESGDIFLPLKNGVLNEKEVRADLFEMCSKTFDWKRPKDAITLFKSVGHSLEDLVAAEYFYMKTANSNYLP